MSDAQPYTPREELERAGRPTGPRTAQGKAKVGKNALRHGLTSKQVVLPSERAKDFQAFEAELVEGLAPVGALEALLVERVVLSAWRIRRAARLDAAFAVYDLESRFLYPILSEGHTARGLEGKEGRGGVERLVTLSRYEAALERSLYRALHELERAQASRRGELVSLPAVLDVEAGEGFVSQKQA